MHGGNTRKGVQRNHGLVGWCVYKPFPSFVNTNRSPGIVAAESESTPNILLISGSPGAGKSAIASSLVNDLAVQQRLGSYFFFKRGDANLGNPASFWRTVAHDLARFHPAVKSSLVDFLSLPGFTDTNILLHFKAMIYDVLTKNCSLLSARPPVIIIDALTECGWDDYHSVQRRVFLDTFTGWSRLPKQFKLIVTSRNS